MLSSPQSDSCLFIFITLLAHTTTHTISTKNFLQLIPTSLFHSHLFIESFLQFPLTFSSCLCTAVLKIYIKTTFPFLSHLVNSGCIKGPMSKTILGGLTLFWFLSSFSKYRQEEQLLIPYRSGSENWCIAGGRHWWRCLQSWKKIHFTFIDNLNSPPICFKELPYYYRIYSPVKLGSKTLPWNFRIRPQQQHKAKGMWIKCLAVVHQS